MQTSKPHYHKWTKEEDQKLEAAIAGYIYEQTHRPITVGNFSWQRIKVLSGLTELTERQLCDRYKSHLSNDGKKGFTEEEDQLLHRLYNIFGPAWKKMEKYLPGKSNDMLRKRYDYLKRTGRVSKRLELKNYDLLLERDTTPKEIPPVLPEVQPQPETNESFASPEQAGQASTEGANVSTATDGAPVEQTNVSTATDGAPLEDLFQLDNFDYQDCLSPLYFFDFD